jgi:cell division protein FtsL
MKITNLLALLAALLLTAAEVLVMDYDARQNVALYQAEAARVLAARG